MASLKFPSTAGYKNLAVDLNVKKSLSGSPNLQTKSPKPAECSKVCQVTVEYLEYSYMYCANFITDPFAESVRDANARRRFSFMGFGMCSVLFNGKLLALLRSSFNVRKMLHAGILCFLVGVILFLTVNNRCIQFVQKPKRMQDPKIMKNDSHFSRTDTKPMFSRGHKTFTGNESEIAHRVVSRQTSNDNKTGNGIIRDLSKSNESVRKLPNDHRIIRGLPSDLVVCVMSAPYNRDARNAIRQTWARDRPKNALVLFVIGTGLLDTAAKVRILAENEFHRDIMIFEDFEESYINLTQKVLKTMKWVTQNIEFSYFMKVDDDTFVRLDMVLKYLASKSKERLYWGFFTHRAPINRQGKWAEPKQYMCDHYVSYALGGGYVLSKDLVEYIATNSYMLQMFRSEDVSVGTWLAPLEITRTHDIRFRIRKSCKQDGIILNPASSLDEMKLLYNRLIVNGTLCGKAYELRHDKTKHGGNLDP